VEYAFSHTLWLSTLVALPRAGGSPRAVRTSPAHSFYRFPIHKNAYSFTYHKYTKIPSKEASKEGTLAVFLTDSPLSLSPISTVLLLLVFTIGTTPVLYRSRSGAHAVHIVLLELTWAGNHGRTHADLQPRIGLRIRATSETG